MIRKRRKKKIKLRHIVLILLLIYISVIMLNQKKLMRDLEARRIELQGEVNVLQKEIDLLTEEIENSDSLEFIEKVAREELGMVKPREIIYIDKGKLKNSFFNIFKRGTNWHILKSNIYFKWKYF